MNNPEENQKAPAPPIEPVTPHPIDRFSDSYGFLQTEEQRAETRAFFKKLEAEEKERAASRPSVS